jgi:hypothetical protein
MKHDDVQTKNGYTKRFFSIPSWSWAITLLIFASTLLWSFGSTDATIKRDILEANVKLEQQNVRIEKLEERQQATQRTLDEITLNLKVLMESQGLPYHTTR